MDGARRAEGAGKRRDALVAQSAAREAEHVKRQRRAHQQRLRDALDAGRPERRLVQPEGDEDVGRRPESAGLNLRRRLDLQRREHLRDARLDVLRLHALDVRRPRQIDDAVDGEAARRVDLGGEVGEEVRVEVYVDRARAPRPRFGRVALRVAQPLVLFVRQRPAEVTAGPARALRLVAVRLCFCVLFSAARALLLLAYRQADTRSMFPTVPFILPHGARFRLESTRLACTCR